MCQARRGAGKAFSFLKKKIRKIKRRLKKKLWRKLKRRLIKGIASGVYKMIRKLARKFHAQGLLNMFHKGKGATTPIGYVLQGEIGKAKKQFSKVFMRAWQSGELSQTLSDIIMPNMLLLMSKDRDPYRQAEKLTQKLLHFITVCNSVNSVLDFQRPTYLVSDQMWQVSGDQGFLNKSETFTTWRTYVVKATPTWWQARARQHSHAKDIRNEKVKIIEKNSNHSKNRKYHELLKKNSKRGHPDYHDPKMKYIKPPRIVDELVEQARLLIKANYSFTFPDLCWAQQRNECPFVPSEDTWKHGKVPHVPPYPNIPTLKTNDQQPLCIAKAEMQIHFCTTCCCKDGYATQTMTSELQYENDPTCKIWFSTADSAIRTVSAVIRGLVVSTRFGLCFETAWRDKENNKATGNSLGEGQGRRGGGRLASAGTFSMGSSNRAGNSELLGMANAKIQELTTRVQELEDERQNVFARTKKTRGSLYV